jgi:hypothetical protein
MIPQAEVVHHIDGRTRLRVPSQLRNRRFFDEAEQRLRSMEGVEAIQTNSTTGSILLVHRGPLDRIVDDAKNAGVLDILPVRKKAVLQGQPLSTRLVDSIERADRWVADRTHGSLDLSGIASLGMAGAGVVQLLRRKVLPPAMALFWYAMVLIPRKRESQRNLRLL